MHTQSPCPYCSGPITLSAEHRNQPIKCPHCGRLSQLNERTTANQYAGSTLNPESPQISTTHDANQTAARYRVMGPAIGLTVTGTITTLMGLMFLPALLFPAQMGEQLPRDTAELAFTILFMLFSLVLGIVTLYGSIQMIRLQNYPLAIAAAITAMVPWYCCLLGLPMGIWAIVVLRDRDVKRAFK